MDLSFNHRPCLPASRKAGSKGLWSLSHTAVGPGAMRAQGMGGYLVVTRLGWFFMNQDSQGLLGQGKFLLGVFHGGKASSFILLC